MAMRLGTLWRSIRSLEKQVLLGSAILLVFAIVAILAPVLAPYNPTTQVGPVYAPPNSAWLLGTDNGGYDVLSNLIYGAQTSLLVGFVAAVLSMADRRRDRRRRRLLRRQDRRVPDARHRLLPRHPGHPADDHRRRPVRSQPQEHHHHHRPHLLDEHRAADPRAGQVDPGANVRPAGRDGRGEPLADPRDPRHPPGRPAARREHGADDRQRDLRRDVRQLPRSRQPVDDLLGQDDPERARRRRDLLPRLVGGAPARDRRHGRRARRDDRRTGHRGCAQPEACASATSRFAASAYARSTGSSTRNEHLRRPQPRDRRSPSPTPAGTSCTSTTSTSGSICGPAASSTPSAASTSRFAEARGSGSSANRDAARRPPSSR